MGLGFLLMLVILMFVFNIDPGQALVVAIVAWVTTSVLAFAVGMATVGGVIALR